MALPRMLWIVALGNSCSYSIALAAAYEQLGSISSKGQGKIYHTLAFAEWFWSENDFWRGGILFTACVVAAEAQN